MESLRPVFVSFTNSVTYSEVHNYLNKFGKVSNFDDGQTLSSPGCIVFGDVRKIYPPVPLVNGKFNCVFIMEQANHLSVPNEEFRVLLQLKSPRPLAELEVGSFLAVYNPRPYIVANMRSFSSGPEGVIVWYSKDPVPITKPKIVNKLAAPVSTASSLKSLEVRSIKKSFIPVSHSQPVASTSSAHRSGDGEDRFNMPPPPSWIDMRRNQRLIGPSVAHSDLKTSHVTPRDGGSPNSSGHLKRSRSHHSTRSQNSKCSHPSCSHHSTYPHSSEHCCLRNRTDHHCCSPHEHQGCCSVARQPQVSCCTHREPPNCHGSLHHSCGCGCSISRSSCHQPAGGLPLSCGGCCRHNSCSSKSSKCYTRALCGTNYKGKSAVQCCNRSCEKTFSTSQEGSQWFIKEWVEQSKSRIGGEKPRFPGDSQDIDSQPLTGRATYGGSVVDEALSDDDNFTSISQVLPTADPAPGPSTRCSQQRSKLVASSSDSDSDSSLSDTSTLFLKRNKTHTSIRVESALTNLKNPDFQASSIVEIEDSLDVQQDLAADKLQSSNVQQDHETNKTSNQIEPLSDDLCHINSDTALTYGTQETCSQEFSVPLILPSKRPGCKSSSDSEDSHAKTKKKRKLFNPKDTSLYFDSARKDPDILSRDKQDSSKEPCEQTDKNSTEVEESSEVKDVVKGSVDIEVVKTAKDGERNKRAIEVESSAVKDAVKSSVDIECSQEFSVPLIIHSKKPGCKSSSDSEGSHAKTKKKRKLFNSKDTSWYFDSTRRDLDVLSHDKRDSSEEPCEQTDKNSTEVEESSGVKDVVKGSVDIEVVNTPKDGERNKRAIELTSQESLGIIPSSDVEIESRNNGKARTKHIFSANFCGDKSSGEAKSKISFDGGLPPGKLVANIIEEWGSDNNGSGSLGPVSVTAEDILRDLTDGDDPVAGVGPVVESNPESQAGCGEKAAALQTRPLLNEESGNSDDVPVVGEHPSTQCVSIEPNKNNMPVRASLTTTQFSPDDSMFTNETLMDVEMSLTLCESREQTYNVNQAEHKVSNRTNPILSEFNQDVNSQTPAVGSQNKNPSALPELCSLSVDTLIVAEPNSYDRNQISETDSSSLEIRPISIEVPVTVHAVEGSPNLLKEDLSHRSRISTNATLLDTEARLEPQERTSNVTNADHILSNRMSLNLDEYHKDVNVQTSAVHSEKNDTSGLIICQYLSELCDSLCVNTSNIPEPNNNGRNIISETENSSAEVGPIPIDIPVTFHAVEGSLSAKMSQTLCEPWEQTSNTTNAAHRISNQMSLTLGESHQDVNVQTPAMGSEKTKPNALSELCGSLSELCGSLSANTSNVAEPGSNDRNQVSETENSSAELRLEIPVTVRAVEVSPHHSPDSTTEGLLEERPVRVSPASTVFYDAESDYPSVENHFEERKGRSTNTCKRKVVAEKARNEEAKHQTSNIDDQDISERVSMPNQIFGVEGAIVDIAPHINEDTMTSIVRGVCRQRCNSRFGHDSVLELPTLSRQCKPCASRSHHACPCCHNSGFQKPLCFEFAFELHVLIGEKILRLQVERQEAVKFLGIRAKQFVRKGRHALEILERLQSLCCTDPEEKTHRLIGRLYVKTEQRLEEIVPLLVSTRLKDFRMSKKPL